MVLLLKLCAIPLYPLGAAIVLIITGLILYRLKKKWWIQCSITGVAVLYLASTPFFTRVFLKILEHRYTAQAFFPQDCSAIVVLGGGGMSLAPPMIYPEINSAGDRILHAARLYKMGLTPRIITTGGFPVGSRLKNCTEGEQNALLLREIGVDSSAILIDKKARTTAEHPRYVAAILDSLHVAKKIILVTSAAHMYRAMGVFKKAGFDVYPAATDFRGNGRIIEEFDDLFPQASSLDDMTAAIHEVYGIVGYRVMGKM